MTTVKVQDRSTGRIYKLDVAMTGPRVNIITYINRTYPHLHIVAFD